MASSGETPSGQDTGPTLGGGQRWAASMCLGRGGVFAQNLWLLSGPWVQPTGEECVSGAHRAFASVVTQKLGPRLWRPCLKQG